MRVLLRWLLVVLVIAITIGCLTGRKPGTGTNTTVGTGSDNPGPWTGGTTPALSTP